METYAVKGAARKMTGHYRRPGTRDLYCNRPAGAPNGIGATLAGWKMCTPCVKAEAADRAAATATAEAWLDQPPASPLAAAALLFGAQVEAVDNRRAAEQAAGVTLDDAVTTVICPQCRVPAGARCVTRAGKPAREAHGRRFDALDDAAGITAHRAAVRREAEANRRWVTRDADAENALIAAYVDRINARAQQAAEAAGTWRAEWISARAASPTPTLFDMEPDAEQGALFA
ncbi:hypothetical protein [Streptomyces sp. NPDC003278]|uniref:zinc finger domain-containing protein n=1 Tax=Streptomyces sp. NPDC003278 TaxID=3364679 RepID=UPI00367C4382